LLGKHVKILLKNVVRLETKGDKTENRVLVSCKSVKYYYLWHLFNLFITCDVHLLVSQLSTVQCCQLVCGTLAVIFVNGDW
jgi:hypothetical protein